MTSAAMVLKCVPYTTPLLHVLHRMSTSSIFPPPLKPPLESPKPLPNSKMERLAAVFRDAASGSGSDHSPENPAADDLFDLVKSFMERDDVEIEKGEDGDCSAEELTDGFSCDFDAEVIELRNLFGSMDNQRDEIRIEAEEGLMKVAGGRSSQGIKRQLMAHLRRKGFDAGLCKSKVQKLRSFPAGDHEYIDVNLAGSRYLVELHLAREFEIARPTRNYTSLLSTFPEIFVGNSEQLKQVVKLMCSAIKQSMKTRNMHVPPWRRTQFVQAKWFGPYKRTTNRKASSGSEEPTASPGFKTYHCREDFGQNVGFRVGNLTAGFGANGLLL